MSLPTITAEGRLGRDPELRFTPTGLAVASFPIACQDRVKDAAGQWSDGDTTWLEVTVWRNLAEAVADQLGKGDLVTVTGRLKVREYETKDGGKGRAVEVTADTVGKVILPTRNGDGARQQSSRPASQPRAQAAQPDPWATAPASGGYAAGGGYGDDEPPF